MKKKYQILSMALLLSDSLFAHSNISNAHMGMIDIADKVHDSTPFKGKINKVYKAVEDGDFLKAKNLMKEISQKDHWELYPVYELADCYLRTQTSTGEYSPTTAYSNLLKITSRGERLTEADAYLFDFGLSISKILERIEHCMYDNAAKENTLQSLDSFIREIKNDNLRQKAETLRREAAYTALQDELDVYNCEKFLERYPTGKYTNEVKDIRDRLAYESIGENIVQLQEYVKKYPNSKYVPDAKVRIEQFNLPVFTVSQAKQIASAQLPGKKILEVFPFSNSARGNDQIICVANCMNDDQQVDANGTFMVLMHLKDINAMKYLTFTCDGNTNLRSHSIDVVDKQRIGETTYIILCYRNFSYGAECRDCVERVYAIYNPDNMTLHKVVYSGKDSFAPDGTLHRIEGEWLPMEDNTYTQWLKNYAEKQLKPYVK